MSLKFNEIIQSTRTRIYDIWEQLILEGTEPDCFTIKERFNDLGSSAGRMFLAELAKYCEKRQGEVGVRITQLTANKYHRMLRYLREYTAAKYSAEDIKLTRVTYEYIDGFCTFSRRLITATTMVRSIYCAASRISSSSASATSG